jgi:hypothetical protein
MHSTAEFKDVLAAAKLPTATTAQLEGVAEKDFNGNKRKGYK